MIPEIKLYGTETCHKTQYYKKYLEDLNLEYSYLDVELNTVSAEELRGLI
jgi:arsenate reductase-like glutaredoxin family protein